MNRLYSKYLNWKTFSCKSLRNIPVKNVDLRNLAELLSDIYFEHALRRDMTFFWFNTTVIASPPVC